MILVRSTLLLLLALVAPACGAPAHPSALAALIAATTAGSKSLDVTVSGSPQWTHTGMDVQAGDKLHITAKGTVTMGNNTGVTADGAQRGWVDTLRALMVPSAGRGALVGRVHRQQRRGNTVFHRRGRDGDARQLRAGFTLPYPILLLRADEAGVKAASDSGVGGALDNGTAIGEQGQFEGSA